jgi:SAM-dependent methyltransferase
MAETWDLFRGDTGRWPDRAFYRDVIERSGQPVLDVGCGTGRLLLDYRAEGIDIDGVDNSPEMLDICRTKAEARGLAVTVMCQDVRDFQSSRSYRTILVPSSSFQLIVESEDARQVMERLFAALVPGGMLIMPFMILCNEPSERRIVTKESSLSDERLNPVDGLLYRHWSRQVFDMRKQLEHTEKRYEVSRNGEVIRSEEYRRSPATRWYTQEQASRLYDSAGFVDAYLTSGFTWRPAGPDDSLFCVAGRRP